MSRESGTATFSAPSPSDVDVQDPNRRANISYTRELLLSLDKSYSIVKLPLESQPLVSCVVDEAPGLLSSTLCAPDYKCQRSVPPNFSTIVLDDVSPLLQRSDEPYRLPCRHQAMTSTRDGNDLLNGDTSSSSECTNQERADRETWKKDTVSVAKEDKWHSSKNAGSKDSPDEFLMSPARRNSKNLQFTSSVISKQLDASQKSSHFQEFVKGDAGLPPKLLETAKNCPTPLQQVQDLTTNGTVIPGLKTVNLTHKGVHPMESEERSNLDVEDLQGIANVMESLKKSMPC